MNTHLARSVRALQLAAVICAAFAAIGVASGFHAADPDSGWFVPLVAGVVVAIGFSITWHVLIGAAAKTRRLLGLTVVIAGGIILAALALAASAQSIATALTGTAAVRAELSRQVTGYTDALAEAHERATWAQPLVQMTGASAAGYRALAEQEAGGEFGTGAGCGTRCAELQTFGDSWSRSASALQEQVDQADVVNRVGLDAVGRLRSAAALGDQTLFLAATQEVGTAVASLEGMVTAPDGILASTGVITVSSTDRTARLDAQTADLTAKARELRPADGKTEVPVFVPQSPSEATRAQMFGASAPGWIAGLAIDGLPLLFLFIALALGFEPLLRDEHKPLQRQTTPERNAKVREDEADTAQGSTIHLVAGE
ncbi:hypothetical protein RM190_19695 [Paracoccus sp. CPCC 101403]|uniref:Uncharacterized protein n=2 Tax=Paracoccus broussonetiae TaxID=3075834 RepID=A0ABU3EIM1_9RHOB|nr:hypothetical protein [Paracoccus sp. CPCC 101403]MDT1064096.1 hypothetical protein [Paracoccus sp. CPCC 101403]